MILFELTLRGFQMMEIFTKEKEDRDQLPVYLLKLTKLLGFLFLLTITLIVFSNRNLPRAMLLWVPHLAINNRNQLVRGTFLKSKVTRLFLGSIMVAPFEQYFKIFITLGLGSIACQNGDRWRSCLSTSCDPWVFPSNSWVFPSNSWVFPSNSKDVKRLFYAN